MSDGAMLLLPSAVGSEFDGCLLDAFCEDEGLALAKLDEIEWRLTQREATALITVSCSLLTLQSSTATVGV